MEVASCVPRLLRSSDAREIGGSWQHVSSIGPPRKEAAGCSVAGGGAAGGVPAASHIAMRGSWQYASSIGPPRAASKGGGWV